SGTQCTLCCSEAVARPEMSSVEQEAMRRELNDRIDQLSDSISRRERALSRSIRQMEALRAEKRQLDKTLQQELARYDSAFVEHIRSVDRENATLTERIRSLEKLREMPKAIDQLQDQAGELQAEIDRTRVAIEREVARLRHADQNVSAIAER